MYTAYTLRRSKRARKVRIAVYCDGAVIVTAPQGLGLGLIERFVVEKSGWILRALERWEPFRKRIPRRQTKKEFLEYKYQALALAKERIEYFNAIYGFSYRYVRIKNQKTRWGSCSKIGNINFNYKIVFLSKRHLDYIVVHELCHLAEFNHSRAFWALVARAIPEHITVRREIKKVKF